MVLWIGTPDAPAPSGTVPAGVDTVLTLAVRPADASNDVVLQYRVNGGPSAVVPATWERNDVFSETQLFTARIPALRGGDHVDYTALCRCAGRRVPAAAESERFTFAVDVADPITGGEELKRPPAAAVAPIAPEPEGAGDGAPRARPEERKGDPELAAAGSGAPFAEGEATRAELNVARESIATMTDPRLAALRDPSRAGIPRADAPAGLAEVLEGGVRAKLAEAGLVSVTRIALMPEQELAARVPELGTGGAREAKKQALAVTGFLQAQLANATIVKEAKDLGYVGLAGIATVDVSPYETALGKLRPCAACASCVSALSAGAYLVDLLDFLEDTFAMTVAAFDKRFLQDWSALPLDCAAAERRIRQPRLAVEILERFVLAARPGWDRVRLYDEMRGLTAAAEPTTRPGVLGDMWDAYLGELGTTGDEVTAAVAAGSAAVADLATRLGIPASEIAGLAKDKNKVGITDVELMPGLIRTARTAGLTAGSDALAEAQNQAEAAVDRVEAVYVTALRDNLVRLALAAVPAHGTAQRLGNHLQLDLSADACQFTTRIGQAIATIHAFVAAYRLGREPALTARWNEARWRWMSSFGIWHAVQTLFWYPENFCFPDLRRNRTPAFRMLLTTIEEEGGTPSGVRKAVGEYEQAVVNLANLFPSSFPRSTFSATLDDRSFLFLTAPEAVLVTEQEPDGTPRSWAVLKAPGDRMCGVTGFNDRLYLFFSPSAAGQGDPGFGGPPREFKEFQFAWIEPIVLDSDSAPKDLKLQSSGDIGRFRNPTLDFPAVVAGPDFVTLYYRWSGDSRELHAVTMDRFHRWQWRGLSYPGIIANAVITQLAAGRPLVGLGHVAGSNYVLFADTAHLYVLRIDEPYAYLPRIGSLQELPVSADFYTGTVKDNSLLLARNSTTGELSAGPPEIGLLAPNALGAPVTWRAVPVQSSAPLIDVSTAEDAVILQAGYGSIACRVTAAAVALLGTSSALVWFRGLPRHPIATDPTAVSAFQRRQVDAYANVEPGALNHQILDEWFFEVPLACAGALHESHFHQDAADWLHAVYHPYRPKPEDRFVWAGFARKATGTATLRDTAAWLRDPFNPHGVARAREGAPLRRTILAYVENVLDWADRLFVSDTSESINQAREFYELALELLGYDELTADPCTRRLKAVLQRISTALPTVDARKVRAALDRLLEIRDARLVHPVLDVLDQALDGAAPTHAILEAVDEAIAADDLMREADTVVEKRRASKEKLEASERVIASADGGTSIALAAYAGIFIGKGSHEVEAALALLAPKGFCTPPNPLLEINRFRAQSSLEKIRTCRNFAGMKRTLATYAAPADPRALATQAAGGGDEGFELLGNEPPPIYRYQYLVARAQTFVETAQQLAAQMLAAIEKQEQEEYNVLRARQEAAVAKSSVALQELRLREANDSRTLAELQRDRVEVQRDYFQELINGGWSDWETATLVLMGVSAAAHAAAAVAAGFGPSVSSVLSETAAALSTGASMTQTVATFERRAREWLYQRDLALKDLAIAGQHIVLADDHVGIVTQERDIAALNGQHADDVVNFLSTKFTNKELYAWMSRTLRRIYREHLNFAVTLARMAQQALSFERQQPVNLIGSGAQYWDAERKGLLGAEQLRLDLAKLDQHRLATNQRKRELTKTISLAAVAPVELEQLRRRGVTEFSTLLEWFDRDFPGHYLRLIKSVSVSFAAIVPPVDAIHSTLSNPGVSRVIVGPPFAEPKVLLRQPEAVSLTAARDASGLFAVDLADDMLLPFEGSGVETTWTLELPLAANRFRFDGLVDVLLTLRYTALDDWGFRQQILSSLGADTAGTVSVDGQSFFSAAIDFPDEWYAFHNPVADPPSDGSSAATPYTLRFTVGAGDFLPNETDHLLRRVLVATAGTAPKRVPVEVTFAPADGDAPLTATADLEEGRLTLADSPAFHIDVTPPYGTWTVRLRTDATGAAYDAFYAGSSTANGQRRLKLDWLTDVFLLLQYRAKSHYPT